MARYLYKALSSAGVEIAGEKQAASRQAVTDWLFGLGHTPLVVEESVARRSNPVFDRRFHLTQAERLRFTQELARLLSAGIALDRGLRIVANVVARPAAQGVILAVFEQIREGSKLADALSVSPKSFPAYYRGMIAAGEISGQLPQNLQRLSDGMARRMKIRERLTSALMYPALLVVLVLATFVLLFTVVLPRLRPLFNDAEVTLPWATRMLFLSAILAASAAWRRPTLRHRIDDFLLTSPICMGLVQKGQVAGFTRSLGTLLEAGLSLPAALMQAEKTIGNSALRGSVRDAAKSVREGSSLSAALAKTGHFPRTSLELIKIGEEVAAAPQMLERVSEIYDRDVEVTVDRLISLAAPSVTIVLGLVVGGLVAALLVGIMSLNDLAF